MPSAADARTMAPPSPAPPSLAAPIAARLPEAPPACPSLLPPERTDAPVARSRPEYPAAALLGKHGGDRKSRSYKQTNQACDVKHGTVEHWKARLRRDDPDLAARVDRGELSANAAAVLKGWRKPRGGCEPQADAVAA
jgi:hypothetical protein